MNAIVSRPVEDLPAAAVAAAARRVIDIEAAAIRALSSRIDGAFTRACQLILACEGRVVVSGIGKSGHIARKIAATLASTGTPAFFVHPAEASHGDLGMITSQDVVLALSNSGETDELLTILPVVKRKGVPLIVGNVGPATFGRDDNTLLLVDADGERALPTADKLTLARALVADIAQRLEAA